MSQKAILQRANVLNAASLQANAAMAVVATMNAERPDVETASFKCGDCNTVFASNAGDEPFCISCGSHHVKADAESDLPPEVLPADEDLAAYHCASCGTYNVMSEKHVASLNGHAHCVSCGTVHNFQQTAGEQDDQEAEDADGEQQQDEGQDQQQQATTEVKAEDQAEEQDQQAEHQVEEPAQQQQQQQASDDTEVETLPLDDSEILVDDTPADDNPVAVEMSLLSAALKADPKATLELCHTGKTILAMVGGLHVATLEETPEFAGMFDKAPFAQSILHVAKSQGVVAALDQFGFTRTAITVPMTAAVNAVVARRVQAQTQALTETSASLSDDLRQSLSIAASALNKGFWKSKSNPLKAAMAQTLTSLGVNNPNRIVASVFASSGDAYVKTLLESALELAGKSVEFRNELAASLQDIEVQQEGQPGEEAEWDQDEGDQQFAATASFEVPARAAKPVTAALTDRKAATSVHQVRASLGGTIFPR